MLFRMNAPLIVIVPTRSRPGNVPEVVAAWRETGAFDDGAELSFVIDADDPAYDEYVTALDAARYLAACRGERLITWSVIPQWAPLVPKLNEAAVDLLLAGTYALGFAGDDHRPRTPGWVGRYLSALRDLGTGVVSCPDGYRTDDLPTQWAMTADIVHELGRMVPAGVEHLYCDDAVRDLAAAAGAYRVLGDVLIDHLNPYAGRRAELDEQYRRVNAPEQYAKDRPIYRRWKRDDLPEQAARVRALRAEREAS
jgi:hypothetical protein